MGQVFWRKQLLRQNLQNEKLVMLCVKVRKRRFLKKSTQRVWKQEILDVCWDLDIIVMARAWRLGGDRSRLERQGKHCQVLSVAVTITLKFQEDHLSYSLENEFEECRASLAIAGNKEAFVVIQVSDMVAQTRTIEIGKRNVSGVKK